MSTYLRLVFPPSWQPAAPCRGRDTASQCGVDGPGGAQRTMEEWGFLAPGQYLIHDRDTKFCAAFQQLIDAPGVKRVPLPPRSPKLNAYAERWVRSVKEECLSRFILFGEASLRHALTPYVEHFHHERNHQGKGNVLLFPVVAKTQSAKGRFSAVNGSGAPEILCARSRMSF